MRQAACRNSSRTSMTTIRSQMWNSYLLPIVRPSGFWILIHKAPQRTLITFWTRSIQFSNSLTCMRTQWGQRSASSSTIEMVNTWWCPCIQASSRRSLNSSKASTVTLLTSTCPVRWQSCVRVSSRLRFSTQPSSRTSKISWIISSSRRLMWASKFRTEVSPSKFSQPLS